MTVDGIRFDPIVDENGEVVKSMEMSIYGRHLIPQANMPCSIPVTIIMKPYIKEVDYLVVAVTMDDKRVGIPIIPKVIRKKRHMAPRTAQKHVKDELESLYPIKDFEIYYVHWAPSGNIK